MSETPIIALRNAVATLVSEDATLDALLSGRKVYALAVPTGSSLNYVVIGPVVLDETGGYYAQPGRRHRRRLSCWARSPWTAEEIYARLVTLLDRQLLPLTGHTMQTASLTVAAGPIEDTDRKAWGLHADWSVDTLETA